MTVSINEFFALQITDNSFGKEKNREDYVIVPTHYLLLEILLIARNVLIINTNWKGKMTKETNWEQQNQETPKNLEHIIIIRIFATYNGTNTENKFFIFKGF